MKIPTHPGINEIWSRPQEPEAMLVMLNGGRGNNMAEPYLAVASGQLSERNCHVPTLGICGTHDQYLWESQMADSAKWMATAWRYAPVDGGSHWVMLDRPQEVN